MRYIERNEEKRCAFIEEIEKLPEDSEIFYIDETGFEEFYTREYGYAPRGKKIIGEVKGKKFTRTNVVSAKHNDKLIAPFAFSGGMDSSLFEGWLEEIFVKHLVKPQSSVIILDNASFHRKDAIYDIADEYGFRVIFLPPRIIGFSGSKKDQPEPFFYKTNLRIQSVLNQKATSQRGSQG